MLPVMQPHPVGSQLEFPPLLSGCCDDTGKKTVGPSLDDGPEVEVGGLAADLPRFEGKNRVASDLGISRRDEHFSPLHGLAYRAP